MASFNKVILIGNLTADPELKQTPNGISVCRFNIAVNRRRSSTTQDQSGQSTADFFTIVTWRERAEFVVRYFKKGRPILVCGQLQTNPWTDQNGQKRTNFEIVADEVAFVENKGDNSAPQSAESYGAPSYTSGPIAGFTEDTSSENLPF